MRKSIHSPRQFACTAPTQNPCRALVRPARRAARAERVHFTGALRACHRGHVGTYEASVRLVDAVVGLPERALAGGLLHVAYVVELPIGGSRKR